jgi:hypothetical protein
MTAPATPNEKPPAARRRRWLALALILAVIVVAALLTPEVIGGRTGDARLTTYSAEAQGAKLLYELASRLGWHVERWTDAAPIAADDRTVMAILAPIEPPGVVATHQMLDRVRGGAALLYVMSGGGALNDSLHVKRGLFGGTYQATAAGTADAARASDARRARRFDTTAADSVDDEDVQTAGECERAAPNDGLSMWPDQTVRLWRFCWTRGRPPGAVIFARSTLERDAKDTSVARSAPAAAGFPLGRGRVVVLSDPDLLRNDVLRVCHWGLDVVAARMLEYLAAGTPRRGRLVFDEYHQGFGTHPGTLRAIVVYLSRAASGHVLLQGLLAGLVLLLALGPRALPVHDEERVERRSPLEHVGALAQAYARVGATRTATTRLVRGLRRRVERGSGTARSRAESDARFLEETGASPSRAADVAVVRHALETPVSRREFEAVGGAIRRLEDSLLAERR